MVTRNIIDILGHPMRRKGSSSSGSRIRKDPRTRWDLGTMPEPPPAPPRLWTDLSGWGLKSDAYEQMIIPIQKANSKGRWEPLEDSGAWRKLSDQELEEAILETSAALDMIPGPNSVVIPSYRKRIDHLKTERSKRKQRRIEAW
jgi:hypothetical protein